MAGAEARLDRVLVERGLAASRNRAAAAVRSGRVRVDGRLSARPSTSVRPDADIVVEHEQDWASRAAEKLAGALDSLTAAGHGGPMIADRRCLDVGASTGGFTDVLLRRGAASVVAVDVGHDQLVPRLATDPRVQVVDGCNARDLQPADIQGAAGLTVVDLSFISLRLVLPALTRCTTDDLLPMIKPQFEVGRERLGHGGVVRDPALRVEAVWAVCVRAAELGWGTVAIVDSVLPGPAGNREVFAWLRRDADPVGADAAGRNAVAAALGVST